jgi:hypothetical protein
MLNYPFIIDSFLLSFPSGPEEKSIYVDANTRIQILETMMMLPHADKEQSAAFIVRTSFLIFKLRPLLTNGVHIHSATSVC